MKITSLGLINLNQHHEILIYVTTDPRVLALHKHEKLYRTAQKMN